MKKLSILALIGVAGSLAVSAMPATAATSAPGGVPMCNNGTASTLDQTKQQLSDELQLSTKQGASIDVWNNCLKVMYTENGHTTIAFYDPSTLDKIATLDSAS
jgi:hypothetical protein